MKQPIEWHEECLRNQREHYNNMLSYVLREQERLRRAEADILTYEEQIARAKREGRDGFDRERFNVKARGE